MWQFTDTSNETVARIRADGAYEAKLVAADDIQEWIAEGNVPEPYVEPPPGVPDTVLMYQARLALLAIDITAAMVEAVMGILPSPQKEQAMIQWEYSPTVKRQNGFVSQIAPALGLTDAQVDQLFIVASGL